MIAALYIEPEGAYAKHPRIDAWCEMRDARLYSGPYPVVAHPPCQNGDWDIPFWSPLPDRPE